MQVPEWWVKYREKLEMARQRAQERREEMKQVR
jgi:hypothetical protein